MRAGCTCVWEYLVADERAPQFQRTYGPEGEWVRLFRRAPGYIRTDLYQDVTEPRRFVTIDFWESQEAYDAFRQQFSGEYEALDSRCEGLTVHERKIGQFSPVDR